ncbi:MAG: hypothetical protein HYW95_01840 [Candidatus Wildermuthbacteria bacterium]|nr:hypothetical protein [Candidatus Wildermuthbacteria bacterium]
MRKCVGLLFLLLLVAGLLFASAGNTKEAHAAVSNWQKGVTIIPRFSTDFESASFQQSVLNAKNANVNFITLVIPYYQSNTYSTDIQQGWDTPTDESLISAINYVHSLGMKVMLKPHVGVWDGSWRAYINPGNREAWFAAYQTVLLRYANIAQQYGVEQLCVGAELISMASNTINPTNTQNWISLIGAVRGVYSGKLTYSANWGPDGFVDEKNQITFWSALDFIGISAYFGLSSWGNNSVEAMKGSWDYWNNTHIRPLSQRYGKPVLFTEIGYKSIPNSFVSPWNYEMGGPPDETAQANAYQALFEYWNGQTFMQGVHWWHWSSDPNAGGPGNTDYMPQGKMAENVMRTWFGQGGTETPPPPPPAAISFTATGSASPSSSQVNQQIGIAATVQATGDAVAGTIVDVEVQDGAGNQLFQQYFENQSFSAGQSRTYNVDWTPMSQGQFYVHVGIFASGWNTVYHWQSSVVSIAVSDSAPPAPSPPSDSSPGQIDVWWPADGIQISGLQPFKALLQGMSLGEYSMFWRVDGDQLNAMDDSMQDYPHKEALVDVSGWDWQASGTYTIDFIAQNLSGAVLAQKTVKVQVVH